MTTDDRASRHPDPDDRRDELASALLDGELPVDERAAARRDPAVAARLAELEGMRARLRDVPPLSASVGDAARAAARAAYDAEAGRAAGVRVTDLGAHRRTGRRMPRWLGAAAAAVALVAGIAGVSVLARNDGRQTGSTAAAPPANSNPGGAAKDRSAPEAAAGGEQPQDKAAPGVTEVGDVGAAGSVGELAARVAALSRLSSSMATSSQGTGTAQPESRSAGAAVPTAGTCTTADVVRARAGAAPQVHGRARLNGRDVDVWVVDLAGARRLLVLDARCEVTADRPLG